MNIRQNKGAKLANWMVITLAAMIMAGEVASKNVFDWRMIIYPSMPLLKKNHYPVVRDFTTRMQNAGFNGMFVDGSQFRKLKKLDASVKADFQAFIADTKKKGISLVPMSQGQGGNPEFEDHNLDEAFLCRGTRFRVGNGVATAMGDPNVAFTNGGFENGKTGWRLSSLFAIDATVKRSGRASLRVDDPTKNYVRASQSMTLKPYTTYELSMWVKTQNIVSHTTKYGDHKCRDIGFTVQSPHANYIYHDRYFRNGIGANSDWKLVKLAFHSLDRTSAQVEVQAVEGTQYTGTVWFDDVKITEVGLQQAVIRPGMEVVVKTNAGEVLAKGEDYIVGKGKLTIPAGSAAKNGDVLLVDWYREANVVASFSNAAMCYESFWEITQQEIALEDDWFSNPKARMMKYSEWRSAGWDPVCNQMHQIDRIGSGRYMSAVANQTACLYGEREAIVLSDAYDPYHNSKENYYVVRGGCVGSGYGLDENIIVLNWCYDKYGTTSNNRSMSMKFFAGTEGIDRPGWGVKKSRQRQILSSGPGIQDDWIAKMTKLEDEGKLQDGDIIGIAYHTYKTFPQYYEHIEAMAASCKAAGRWGTGPIPFRKNQRECSLPAISESRKNMKPVHANSLSISKSLVRFTVAQSGQVELSIVNLQGQTVKAYPVEPLTPGSYERKIDVSKMASGVYFARLEMAGKSVRSITRKMIVF